MQTSDTLELAEVDGKNGLRGRGLRKRVHRASSSWREWDQVRWYFLVTTPTARMDSFGQGNALLPSIEELS